MHWLERFRRWRAGRRFAGRLRPVMVRGWGYSKFYTIGQVKAGLREARLGGAHVAIAYAGLLSEADFAQARAEYPIPIPYADARRWFMGGRRGDQPMPYAFAPDGGSGDGYGGSGGGGSGCDGGGDGGGGGD